MLREPQVPLGAALHGVASARTLCPRLPRPGELGAGTLISHRTPRRCPYAQDTCCLPRRWGLLPSRVGRSTFTRGCAFPLRASSGVACLPPSDSTTGPYPVLSTQGSPRDLEGMLGSGGMLQEPGHPPALGQAAAPASALSPRLPKGALISASSFLRGTGGWVPSWLLPSWCGEQDRQTDVQMGKTKQRAEAVQELLRSVGGAAKHPCPRVQARVEARGSTCPTARPTLRHRRLQGGLVPRS